MTGEEPLRQRYLRRLKFGVVLILLLAAPVAWLAIDAITRLHNRPWEWVPDSIPEKVVFTEFLRRFSAAEVILISWDGATLGSESLEKAVALLQPLCSETPASQRAADVPAWAEEEIQEIRVMCGTRTPLQSVRSGTDLLERMTSSPAKLPRAVAIRRLQGSIIGPDHEQTCLLVCMGDEALAHRRIFLPKMRQMIARVTGRSVSEVAVVGSSFEGATVDDESVRSIQRYSPPSAILAAALCFLCLRSLPMTAVITAVAVLGEGLVLALVNLSGTPMNAVLIVLPPLVFVLTVSSGIHLSNYYLDVAREFPELSTSTAAGRAMRAGVMPCLLATGTTVIGLGSLVLVQLGPIQVFGFVASMGVSSTLLLLFLLLPGAMVMTRTRHHAKSQQAQPRRQHWFPNLQKSVKAGFRWSVGKTRRRLSKPWPVIIAFAIVALVMSSGLWQLGTSVNIPRMFLPESDLRTQYRWFERRIGPTVTGEVLVSFPPRDEREDPLDRLELIKQAHVATLNHPKVEAVLSALTFVPPVPTGSSLSKTATRSVIRSLISDPESSLADLGFISRDAQAEVWRINVRMPQSEDIDYSREIAEVRDAVAASLADSSVPASVVFTGNIAIVQKAQEVLLRDLFRSFLAAFGIVAAVMVVLLRNLVGGLLAMLPNLFPTAVLFGWMGLIQLPLDIGSVMTASVALGIAVDDTIHLLSRFGSRRGRGLGQIRAAWGAVGQCGWAMFQTTTICGLSLLVYRMSDFVPTSRFALLMFGLLSAALLGDLFLLPAMMCSPLGRWLAKPFGADPGAQLSHHDQPHLPPDYRRLGRRWKNKLRRV